MSLPAAAADPVTGTLQLPAEVTRQRTPGEVFRFGEHQAPVMDVAVSANARYLATAGHDMVAILDLKTLKTHQTLRNDSSEFFCVALSRDASWMFTGSGPGEQEHRNILIWESKDVQLRTRIIGRDTGTLSIVLSPDGASIMTTHETGLSDLRRVANPGHSYPLVAHDRSRTCWDADFSPDSRYVATAGGDGRIFIWQVGGVIRPVSRMAVHDTDVRGVAFAPDARWIVSASNDRTLRMWSNWMVEDSWQMDHQLDGHKAEVTSVAVSPDGSLIASGSLDKTVRVWSAATGKTRHIFRGHTGGVTAVVFLCSNQYLASSSRDGTVRLWYVGGKSAAPHDDGPPPDASSPRRPAVTPKDELPVPVADDVAAATELIREVFKAEYAQARRSPEKIALAKKILQQGRGEQNAPAERYALLTVARRMAVQAGNTSLALDATDEIIAWYQVRPLELRTETVVKLTKTAQLSGDQKALAEFAVALADDCLAADRYDEATQLAEAIVVIARKVRSGVYRQQGRELTQRIERGRQAFDAYQQAVAKLADDPDDAQANLTAGRFTCFIKGDWRQGLAQLAKASDAQFKDVAEKDLARPTSAAEQVALGDAWHQLSASVTAAERPACLAAAAYWYQRALPKLTGLRKLKIENQLKQIGELPAAVRRK